MILLVDNYDSFVYTLGMYVAELGFPYRVIRNDEYDPEAIAKMHISGIIISPGPCTPAESGYATEIVAKLGHRIPILGVCLGHQIIAAAFGDQVIRADKPVHGKQSLVYHEATGLFEGIPSPFPVARYHSLIVELKHNSPLHITSRLSDGMIMGISHQSWPVHGVQFHPESILTQHGQKLISNFLNLCTSGSTVA